MKFTFMFRAREKFGSSATVAAVLATSFALLTGFVAGCSSAQKDNLDMAGAVKQITSELTSRFHVDAKHLTCPDQVTVDPGAKFTCDGIDRAGKRFTIEATLIGDAGKFTFAKPQFKGGG